MSHTMSRRHPPGPLNFLAPLGLTYRHLIQLWARPLEFATEIQRKYGNVAFFRVFGKRLYMVNDPALIHEVLVDQKNKFRKVERQLRPLRQLVGDGILTNSGDSWLRQRRLLQKAFCPEKLGGYAEGMVEQTELLLDHWDGLGHAASVDLCLEMTRLTLGIATRAFFGRQPRRRAELLARANLAVSEAFTREMLSIFRLPDWLPLRGKIEKRRGIQAYVDEVRTIIQEKRDSAEDSDDLLSAVLNAVDAEGDGGGMTNEQALDELLTIFVASHHTTSVALSWTLYLLGKHEDVQQRLLDEVQRVVGSRSIRMSDLPRLHYTEMVIKESLRLHPPAYVLFAREALEDVHLGGHWIPKGGWIYMYPYVVHRDARNFENPESFDPERFSPERAGRIPQHAYMPFGMGPHVCIGQRFAMMEFMLAIPTILRRYRMRIEPGHESKRSLPLLANHLRDGLPVRLSPRERGASPVLLHHGALEGAAADVWQPSAR